MRFNRVELESRTRLLLLALVILLPSGVAHADAGCDDEVCAWIVVDLNSIVEDPDPILVWREFTESLGYPMNPGGEVRGDGPLDGVIDPFTGLPAATWAYNTGSNFEIAFTRWTYDGWAPYQFLTANAWDDLDPQLTVGDDGTMYVVWWHSEGTQRDIRMSTGAPNAGRFEIPYVIAENGRHPSVVTIDDTLIVAFERPVSGGRQEVVVRQQRLGDEATERVFATVARHQPLHVRLVKATGFVWMYWHHTDHLAGYTEYAGDEWGATPNDLVGGDRDNNGAAAVEMVPRF